MKNPQVAYIIFVMVFTQYLVIFTKLIMSGQNVVWWGKHSTCSNINQDMYWLIKLLDMILVQEFIPMLTEAAIDFFRHRT